MHSDLTGHAGCADMHRIDTDDAQDWITVAGAGRAYNQPLRGRRTLLGTVRGDFSSRLARMGTATLQPLLILISQTTT